MLREDIEQLKSSVLLLSAPDGISLTSGDNLQLAASKNIIANAGNKANIGVVKDFFIGVGRKFSLFVRRMGIKIVANQGEISVQAQNDLMELIARKSISITSTEDEIFITAKKKITINANGSYITLDSSKIEHGTTGDFIVKSATFEQIGPASYTPKLPQFPILNEGKHSLRFVFEGANTVVNAMDWLIDTPYKVRGCFGDIKSSGVIDETGKLARAIVDEAEELILTIGKETWDMLDLSS